MASFSQQAFDTTSFDELAWFFDEVFSGEGEDVTRGAAGPGAEKARRQREYDELVEFIRAQLQEDGAVSLEYVDPPEGVSEQALLDQQIYRAPRLGEPIDPRLLEAVGASEEELMLLLLLAEE